MRQLNEKELVELQRLSTIEEQWDYLTMVMLGMRLAIQNGADENSLIVPTRELIAQVFKANHDLSTETEDVWETPTEQTVKVVEKKSSEGKAISKAKKSAAAKRPKRKKPLPPSASR
jgi:hypothetical protein